MKKRFIVAILLLLVFFILIQYFVGVENYFAYFFILPGMLIGFIFAVLIHELGHLVFGFITGYKFISFKILCFNIYKKGTIKIMYDPFTLAIPGQCLMKPNNRRYALYNLGGLIFSYIFSIVLLVLFFRLSNIFIAEILYGCFIINTLLAIINSLYTKNGINDICNFINCKRSELFLESLLYQLDVIASLTSDNKFKSIYNPSDDVKHTPSNISIAKLKYFKAFHEKNNETMEKYYSLLKGYYNKTTFSILKLPALIIILNHEFIIKKDETLVVKTIKRIKNKDLKTYKKFKQEYFLLNFYINNVVNCNKFDVNELDWLLETDNLELMSKLNNNIIKSLKNVYNAYVRNNYTLNRRDKHDSSRG